MADITEWFRRVDRDRSGKIDVKELQSALALGNLNFSLQTVAQMMKLYDADRSGTMTLQEFQGLHGLLIEMQQTFQRFDRDRSGALTRDEVFQALTAAGFHLDQHAFEALFGAYDPDRSQSLGLPEYMGMSVFLKHTANMFRAFDAQRTGRITLDYNQFVYAMSHCR